MDFLKETHTPSSFGIVQNMDWTGLDNWTGPLDWTGLISFSVTVFTNFYYIYLRESSH